MTGLLLLNVGFLVAGGMLLWGLGAFDVRADVVRLGGVAYLLGVAAVVLLTLQLTILGIGVRPSLGLAFAATLAVGVVPVVRRGVRPRFGSLSPRGWWWILGLAFAVPLGVYFGFVCRLAPKLGVWEPDAVTTWTLRAKSLYFYDGIDVPSLRASGAFAYPLFESMLQGLAFVGLGKADDLAFHVQFALLLIGFVAAVAGLARHAGCPVWVAWPFAALFAIAPEAQARGLSPLADLTLDYLFALGAVLLVLWIEHRRPWLLVAGSVFLAAAISTKREGLLLAAIAYAVALPVAWSAGGRRRAVPIAVAGLCALLTFVPWRVWVALHGSATDVGNLSPNALQVHSGRLGPAASLLARRTFAYDSWFLLVPATVALAVLVVVAAPAAAKRLAQYFLAAGVLAFLGFVAVWWLVPDLNTASNQEQPAGRLVGALATLAVVFAPLLAARLVAPDGLRAAGDGDRAGERLGRADESAAVPVDLR